MPCQATVRPLALKVSMASRHVVPLSHCGDFVPMQGADETMSMLVAAGCADAWHHLTADFIGAANDLT